MSDNKKTYLGDGVYVEADYHGLILTTSDGLCDTNTIVLEAEVYAALVRFVEQRFR